MQAIQNRRRTSIFWATYDTGLGANGSEIISVRHRDGLAVLTNIAGSIDVLDLSNPVAPVRVRRVNVDTSAGTPNSAAVHPRDDFFLVVLGRAGQQGEVAAYRLSDGSFIASGLVGIQPDSIAISPNGQHAVIANEAEAAGEGLNGGDGSVSIVNLANFDSRTSQELEVTNIALPSQAGVPGFSTQRTDDIGRLAVDNTPATLEPESVAFSKDSRFAYVTLQENNGVVRVTLRTGELVFFGLGTTTPRRRSHEPWRSRPTQDCRRFENPMGSRSRSRLGGSSSPRTRDTRDVTGSWVLGVGGR